jgi:DnaK suppressor protein
MRTGGARARSLLTQIKLGRHQAATLDASDTCRAARQEIIMPPLTPALVDQLTVLLQQQRAALMEHVHAHGNAADDEAPEIGPRAHMVEGDDAPEAEMIGDDEARIVGHDDTELGAINRALGRLQAGGAGICISCGAEIPAERLLACPTAEYCIECQRDIELCSRRELRGEGPTM